MGSVIAKTLFTVGATMFTEKVMMNLLLILATWLAKKTSTDLDDNLVVAIKNGLDQKNGVPQGNIYDNVKATVPRADS